MLLLIGDKGRDQDKRYQDEHGLEAPSEYGIEGEHHDRQHGDRRHAGPGCRCQEFADIGERAACDPFDGDRAE